MHQSDGLNFSSAESAELFREAVRAVQHATDADKLAAKLVVSTIAAYTLRPSADHMTGVADVD